MDDKHSTVSPSDPDSSQRAAHPELVPPTFRYVFLKADWRDRIAGTVLRVDDDTLKQLDKDRAEYREATEIERSIAGFPVEPSV